MARPRRNNVERRCKKWSDAEITKILEYILQYGNFEKPTARIYYSKLIKHEYIDANWDLVRWKVVHQKRLFRKALEWEREISADPMKSQECKNRKAKQLKICPHFDLLSQIFSEKNGKIVEKFYKCEVSDHSCDGFAVDTDSQGTATTQKSTGIQQYRDPLVMDSDLQETLTKLNPSALHLHSRDDLTVGNEAKETATPTKSTLQQSSSILAMDSNSEEAATSPKSPVNPSVSRVFINTQRPTATATCSIPLTSLASLHEPEKQEGASTFRKNIKANVKQMSSIQAARINYYQRKLELEQRRLELDECRFESNLELEREKLKQNFELRKLEIERDERVSKYEIEMRYKIRQC